MADSVERFVSVDAQWAKVSPTLKGGDQFMDPIEHPAMQFQEGHDPLVLQKLEMTKTPKVSPSDPWINRRSNSSY